MTEATASLPPLKPAQRLAAAHRLAVVVLLGFASGLPLALTGQAMQAWLSVSGVDLATIGRDTVEALAILALEMGRELEFEDHGGEIVPGNENAIRFAVRNLVENAIRPSPVGRAGPVIVGPGPRPLSAVPA